MKQFSFDISHKSAEAPLARVGVIHTPHGAIQTPAFIPGGTNATVKALTNEQVSELGGQAVLANTYHLYLRPGTELIEQAGGLGAFMNWQKPTFTDSGGFQVFSLGVAYKKGIDKVASQDAGSAKASSGQLMKVDGDGVSFRSHIDGSKHRFTPEVSMQAQWAIGADIHFAFDECVAPLADKKYLEESLGRTHVWAERSLAEHQRLASETQRPYQALFGVVQGARHEDLRKESASFFATQDFDGYGIGGTYYAEDLELVLPWINTILPENKPRHLLGMGSEPRDLFVGVALGCDTFDCVAPTRMARNGTIYTLDGRINLKAATNREKLEPLDKDCDCYTCTNHSMAYVHHLFRADEMLAATLASIHNERFVVRTVDDIRKHLLEGTFLAFKEAFLKRYYD